MKTDYQLKKDIVDELAWESAINDNAIGVEVRDGIVTLSGNLDSYAEKYLAERAVQRVAGVRGLAVEIDVVLPGPSQRTDADVARTAAQGLEWNALVPKDRVKVMVEYGWITLSGEVDYEYQRMAAESALRSLLGVVGISNHISVKPIARALDIKTDIEAALQRRAHSTVKGIEVAVNGDQITLNGSVASLAERQEAFRAAAKTPGVSKVIDKLSVVS
ncbi:BON domain-containing protein [Herminiimonas fonticola]|uniref:Osmotically-inducible protein OsmY n=1 Tax=Herminiimonas fonticola TaxID=303380 RepID=A0A4R6G1D5_9BURK|nr:BON domain-containing protein [Herminiimonas fonticola]RBA23631.1 BON domain [Herminiimonas fonticola]TDN88037.1 osmotically-inducible protein OsmY [Herminiimonas fonticola]